MKFLVFYHGNVGKFRGFQTEIQASTERDALQSALAGRLDLFPDENDNWHDSDGQLVSPAGTDYVDYEDGAFLVEEMEVGE